MMQYDPRHAPEHIVANLAANMPTPRPRYPGDVRTPERHLAFAREIADRIWAEAYTAGAAYGLSIASAQAIIIQAEPTTR